MRTGNFRQTTCRLACALVIGLATLSGPLSPAQARGTPDTAPQTLDELNAGFRALYHQRTREVLENLPLVLIVQNNNITEIRGNQRQDHPVPLSHYTQVKSLLHTLLGFHGLMMSLSAQGSQADWNRLDVFLAQLKTLNQTVSATSLDADEKTQALALIQSLEQFATRALTERHIDLNKLRKTLQSTQPSISALAMSAGKRHAHGMTQILTAIQSKASAQEWNEVVAVVTGPMTARRNNLETAIVASVLGTQHLGTRIFYAENIFSVEGALNYLQTVRGDQELSQSVFDTPFCMWQDLLAPVSRTLVDQSFYTDLAD